MKNQKNKENNKKKSSFASAAVFIAAFAAIVLAMTFFIKGENPFKKNAESTTGYASSQDPTNQQTDINEGETDMNESLKVTNYAEITIADYGTITLALYGETAPETVRNFVSLAESGFYDGLTFHRIMAGFMMQGGAPDGNSYGGSDKNIPGEFAMNGFNNPISHTRGAISMARSQNPNSASSQFFIVHEDSTFLDGQYAAFGFVTEGIEIVDAVCENARPTDNNGTIPSDAQPVITSIVIKEA